MRDLGSGAVPLGATHRRPRDWAGALQPGRQTYLPTSPHISLWHSQAARRISPSLAISPHNSPHPALQPGRQASLRLERSSAGRPDRRLSLAAAPARGRPLAARPLRGLGRPVSPRRRGDAGCCPEQLRVLVLQGDSYPAMIKAVDDATGTVSVTFHGWSAAHDEEITAGEVGQKPHGETDGGHGHHAAVELVLDHVPGVLEELVPWRVA